MGFKRERQKSRIETFVVRREFTRICSAPRTGVLRFHNWKGVAQVPDAKEGEDCEDEVVGL